MRRLPAVLACLFGIAGPASGQNCDILGTEVICSNEMAVRIAANPSLYASLVADSLDSRKAPHAARIGAPERRNAGRAACQQLRGLRGCH